MSEISDISGIEASTNTNPFQIGFFNGKKKKKPHNINIDKINKNQVKVRKPNSKYSDKQNHRIYKTKIELNFSEIKI